MKAGAKEDTETFRPFVSNRGRCPTRTHVYMYTYVYIHTSVHPQTYIYMYTYTHSPLFP